MFAGRGKWKGLLKGVSGLKPQDVFATSLYTGNSGTQTITNGLNLSGEGGLVWAKKRSTTGNHILSDTIRGTNSQLSSNTTSAVSTFTNEVTAFNANGFTLGSSSTTNANAATHAAWSFRRAPKFFDVVTYTGDGVSGLRALSHNLGIAPGLIIVKPTSGAGAWECYHRGLTSLSRTIQLNSTSSEANQGVTVWDAATTTFSVSAATGLNDNGVTYVAYLFAHDTAADGVVQCGSYTGNGSATGPAITLGWEPQFLIVKRANGSTNWLMFDSARDASNPRTARLYANASDAEVTVGSVGVDFLSTGFQPVVTSSEINASGSDYIYLAIRAPI